MSKWQYFNNVLGDRFEPVGFEVVGQRWMKRFGYTEFDQAVETFLDVARSGDGGTSMTVDLKLVMQVPGDDSGRYELLLAFDLDDDATGSRPETGVYSTNDEFWAMFDNVERARAYFA